MTSVVNQSESCSLVLPLQVYKTADRDSLLETLKDAAEAKVVALLCRIYINR